MASRPTLVGTTTTRSENHHEAPIHAGRRSRRPALLLASLAAQASSPAEAAAAGAPSNKATTDSLVFLKDGKVWVSGSDGSGARQFTTNAYGWSSPSMDDQGNVVVVGGLARVNSDGSDSDGSSENGKIVG